MPLPITGWPDAIGLTTCVGGKDVHRRVRGVRDLADETVGVDGQITRLRTLTRRLAQRYAMAVGEPEYMQGLADEHPLPRPVYY
jgi:hypothetical protein